MDKPPLIRRVVIHNYKSIEKCDVTLGRFNVFVGRNGSGKSNFLDALQFVADALFTGSLSHALERRGGMLNVLRSSKKSPRSFRIELEVQVSANVAQYHVQIATQPHGGFVVEEEGLEVNGSQDLNPDFAFFKMRKGELIDSTDRGEMRKVSKEGLYLPIASALPEYESIYDALSTFNLYNPFPDLMRLPHEIEAGRSLEKSGSNLASAVSRLSRERPATLKRIVEYLAAIVTGLSGVSALEIGGFEILQFEQQTACESHPRTFQPKNMSDGTMRSLAVLVAALQFLELPDSSHAIGIEEPESAIHPAAMAVLLDALREASVNTQILITTHSPDLLDRVDIETDSLFAVSDESGSTVIAPIDNASASVIRDHLYTPGELLRTNQLEPRIDYPSEKTVME